MKCLTPEIAWHDREPVFSVDVQPIEPDSSTYRLASAGADTHIVIWRIHRNTKNGANDVTKIECVADLTEHGKSVNIVRFSPSSELLASGDDDSVVMIWKKKDENSADFSDLESVKTANTEQWICRKILRLHIEDVFDISWSADSTKLISASVDNTAVIWNAQTGRSMGMITSHKGFVQGVTWDPLDQFVASLSSDRTCRVFCATSRNIISKCSKAILPVSSQNKADSSDAAENNVPVAKKIFHDETIKTFFRRLSFSPDGKLLVVPSGVVENPDSKPTNATFVFLRNAFHQPIMYYPSGAEYTIAVRCCPVLFKLKNNSIIDRKLFNFPYRMVIAVATTKSVLLYDTEHATPFGYITDMHYSRLTDLSWSSTGNLLVVSSIDGYCTLITFADNELGEPYVPDDN